MDSSGISVLYEKLQSIRVDDYYTDYHTFNNGGQVLHEVLNIPGLEVGFFNTAKAVSDLQNMLLGELQKARSSISGFMFSRNRKGIMINRGALEFRILAEGTHYIYNAHEHINTPYRTRHSHNRTVWHRFRRKTYSYWRVDVEWYKSFAHNKFVNIADLFWNFNQYQTYLNTIKSAYNLIQTIRNLETEQNRIQNEINGIN